MWIDTTYRSKEIEIMDDLEMGGATLIDTLDQLGRINKWLGGNQVTLTGIKALLTNHPKDQEVSMVDFGCGHGDMLRQIADWGRKKGFTFRLIGIDANQTTINYAIELSKSYPEITFLKEDALAEDVKETTYDIALCTLFLHHFEDEVALAFLQKMLKQSRLGIVINDLHRHPMAYYLFSLLCLFIRNHMVKADGLTSILKGFKKEELAVFSKKLGYRSTIHWKWAFRYQWIIRKK